FICNVAGCNRAFTRRTHLLRHMNIHTKTQSFKCPVEGCGRQFSRKDNMMAHVGRH
ncbi:hypothetical protein GQ42DRAFT_113577, partial [Ramicandelaber brevisporus]